MTKIKSRIWKKDEFREFLATIKEGKVEHWQDVAKAIGVNDNTITHWKQLPEAQDAITIGIAYTLQQMESAGKKDWRMWEAKLKMLGVNPSIKIDATVNDPRGDILEKYGLGDTSKTKEAQKRPSEDSA